MLGVVLPCWNTENIKSAIKEWYEIRNTIAPTGDVIIRFPWTRVQSHPSDFPRIPDFREFKGKMSIIINGNQLGVVNLEGFTRHCGICAIHSFHCLLPADQIKSLWLKTIENYIIYMGFSVIVASDGAHNSWAGFLQTQEGWIIQDLIGNRRMEHTKPSKLMWKCLTNTQPEFNWKDNVFKVT